MCMYIVYCTGYSYQAQRQPINRTAVAGLSTNINIWCTIGTNAFFWRINGLVYIALHVPDEYRVCDVARCDPISFTIPVVLEEMDGNTFQSFNIDYQNNVVHLGRQTMLTVVPYESAGMRTQYTSIHPISSYFTFTEATVVTQDVLEFDYTQFSVGPVNTTIRWTYRNLTCQPTVFMVEGYNDTATITTGQPVLTLNSTSTMTLLPNISTVPLYLRLLAYDETGTSCAEDSATRYYTVDSNGEICHSLSVRGCELRLLSLSHSACSCCCVMVP